MSELKIMEDNVRKSARAHFATLSIEQIKEAVRKTYDRGELAGFIEGVTRCNYHYDPKVLRKRGVKNPDNVSCAVGCCMPPSMRQRVVDARLNGAPVRVLFKAMDDDNVVLPKNTEFLIGLQAAHDNMIHERNSHQNWPAYKREFLELIDHPDAKKY